MVQAETPNVFLVQPASATVNAVAIGGSVIPYRTVTVAAQRAGRITELYAREGMMLRFNQPVAALDDDVLRQKIAGVNAEISASQSTLNYTIYAPQSGAAMAGGMMGMMMGSMFGAPGGSDVDSWLSRVNRINQARAKIDELKAQKQALKARVAYGAVTAPMSGIVTDRLVEAGEIVQAGQPLIKMAYVDRLRAEFDVPVDLAQGLRLGQILSLKTSSGRVLHAPLAEFAPGVDARTHTQRVKLDLNRGSGLLLGDYVELLLPRPVASGLGRGAVIIPAKALLHGSALPMVQIVTGDGHYATRIVRVAEKLPNGKLLISSGLHAGEIVRVQP